MELSGRTCNGEGKFKLALLLVVFATVKICVTLFFPLIFMKQFYLFFLFSYDIIFT